MRTWIPGDKRRWDIFPMGVLAVPNNSRNAGIGMVCPHVDTVYTIRNIIEMSIVLSHLQHWNRVVSSRVMAGKRCVAGCSTML
jgi:hypothetical protein